MGCYVNPPGESKEDFLLREGRQLTDASEATISDAEYPVCLVYNGAFTAAAVGYNMSEVQAFADVNDPRPKVWYMVPTAKLLEVSDLIHYVRAQ